MMASNQISTNNLKTIYAKPPIDTTMPVSVMTMSNIKISQTSQQKFKDATKRSATGGTGNSNQKV
jgi:hypothetical protein